MTPNGGLNSIVAARAGSEVLIGFVRAATIEFKPPLDRTGDFSQEMR